MNSQRHTLSLLQEELELLVASPYGRRAFLGGLGFLLASCASAPQTRYREGRNEGQDVELTPTQERALTTEALTEMRKDYPVVQNTYLQNYVSGLGQDLVRANNLSGKPYIYNFSVVDVAYVNAFALPAGTVFVTAPLLEMADTEAELVGVIGHEVGHIQARHTAERMYKAKKDQGKGWLYAVGGGLFGGALGFGVGKLLCAPKDQKCLSKAAQLGAVSGVAGGLLVQKYAFMANSREDEMEADRIGFRTSIKSGYHKDHVGSFYAKLLKMEQESKNKQVPLLASVTDAMSTHPPSRERVQQMQQMAAEAGSSGRKISSAEFDQAKKIASQIAQAARARAKA